jgi:putative ABC transport system permease protein
MNTLWQDERYSLRMLVKSPGISLLAILTLALGIGSVTSMFSTADAPALRPLLVRDVDRLYLICDHRPDDPKQAGPLSPADFRDFRENLRLLENLSAWHWWPANLTGENEPERVRGYRVSGEFFQAMGEPPLLGRMIQPADDQSGVAAVGERTHEIGVRMALGAEPRNVLWLFVWRALLLVGSGLGAGLVLSVALARSLASLVFGTSALDPLAFSGVVVVLLLSATLACVIPARRAARVDPMQAPRFK